MVETAIIFQRFLHLTIIQKLFLLYFKILGNDLIWNTPLSGLHYQNELLIQYKLAYKNFIHQCLFSLNAKYFTTV